MASKKSRIETEERAQPLTAQERAKEGKYTTLRIPLIHLFILAMLKRSKKVDTKKQSYTLVIIGFCAVCVAATLFTIFSKKQKFSEMLVIDDAQMLVHNGQGHQFQHGANSFFKDKTIADAK